VVVDDRRVGLVREVPPGAGGPRGRPHPAPQTLVGRPLSREPQALVAHVVEKHHRARPPGMSRDVGTRAAQAGVVEVRALLGQALRRLLAVEEDQPDLARAPRSLQPLQVAPQLDDDRAAGRAVVRADEALRLDERVVVRADDEPGPAALERPDHVAQPRLSRNRLEAAAGKARTQALGHRAQLRRTGRALAVTQLQAHEPPRGLDVEAVRGGDPRGRRARRRGVRGPTRGKAGQRGQDGGGGEQRAHRLDPRTSGWREP
jgi:hypothetical protein